MMDMPDEFPIPREAFDRQRELVGAHVAAQHRLSHVKRGRLSFVTIAAAGLLGALLVSPARGIGDHLLDLLKPSPAPPEVQTYFAANDELREKLFAHAAAAGHKLQDRFSHVVAREAHGIAAIQSVDGAIYLWAAPTEDGRECWLIQAGAEVATGRPYGSGSCDAAEGASGIRPSTMWTVERSRVLIVHTRVYDDAISRIDILVRGAQTASLRVIAGHALGTVGAEAHILAAVGRNSEGAEVTRVTLG